MGRTDRTLVFYESRDNLAKLWDVLAVYAWMDSDVGYCQGWLLCLLKLQNWGGKENKEKRKENKKFGKHLVKHISSFSFSMFTLT